MYLKLPLSVFLSVFVFSFFFQGCAKSGSSQKVVNLEEEAIAIQIDLEGSHVEHLSIKELKDLGGLTFSLPSKKDDSRRLELKSLKGVVLTAAQKKFTVDLKFDYSKLNIKGSGLFSIHEVKHITGTSFKLVPNPKFDILEYKTSKVLDSYTITALPKYIDKRHGGISLKTLVDAFINGKNLLVEFPRYFLSEAPVLLNESNGRFYFYSADLQALNYVIKIRDEKNNKLNIEGWSVKELDLELTDSGVIDFMSLRNVTQFTLVPPKNHVGAYYNPIVISIDQNLAEHREDIKKSVTLTPRRIKITSQDIKGFTPKFSIVTSDGAYHLMSSKPILNVYLNDKVTVLKKDQAVIDMKVSDLKGATFESVGLKSKTRVILNDKNVFHFAEKNWDAFFPSVPGVDIYAENLPSPHKKKFTLISKHPGTGKIQETPFVPVFQHENQELHFWGAPVPFLDGNFSKLLAIKDEKGQKIELNFENDSGIIQWNEHYSK